MRSRTLIVALVLLLLPSTVLAQRGRRGGGRGMATLTQNVAALLIENRTDLSLSDEVVAQLEALGTAFDERTDSLRVEITTAMQARRGGRGERRGGPPEEMEGLRATMMALQQRNDEFFETEVRPLLSEEQATMAAALITSSRGARGRRGGRRGGGR